MRFPALLWYTTQHFYTYLEHNITTNMSYYTRLHVRISRVSLLHLLAPLQLCEDAIHAKCSPRSSLEWCRRP